MSFETGDEEDGFVIINQSNFFSMKKKDFNGSNASKLVTEMAKVALKSQAKEKGAEMILSTAAGKTVASTAYHGCCEVVNSVCKSGIGKKVVSSMASGIAGKSLAGAASRSVVSSALKGNAVTASVGMVISSAGDTKDYLDGTISGKQYAKKLTSNAAGVGGGMAGWAAGAAVGSAFGPVGTVVGGLIGSFLGCNGASSATKSILD